MDPFFTEYTGKESDRHTWMIMNLHRPAGLLKILWMSILSNWYVRLCRRRFWKGEYEHDKICAYQTLYECLETISSLMAPISPFFSDLLFQNSECSNRTVIRKNRYIILIIPKGESKVDRSSTGRKDATGPGYFVPGIVTA